MMDEAVFVDVMWGVPVEADAKGEGFRDTHAGTPYRARGESVRM